MNKKTERFLSKQVGNDAEAKIDEMAIKSQLQFDSESVVDGAKRRKKGGIDKVYRLVDKNFNAEVKSTGKYSVSYSRGGNDAGKDITNHQISILNKAYREKGEDGGFFIEYRPAEYFLFVHINDFMKHMGQSKWKQFKVADAIKIGLKFTNLDWVKDYKYEPKECQQILTDAELTPIEKMAGCAKVDKPVDKIQIGMKLDIF